MAEYDKMIFANNLNRFINEKGVKQTDICKLLDVSKSTVSSWCSGEKTPRMDKVEALANYFGIMKSDLIEEKPATNKGDELTPEKQQFLDMVMKLDNRRFQMVVDIVDSVLRERDE